MLIISAPKRGINLSDGEQTEKGFLTSYVLPFPLATTGQAGSEKMKAVVVKYEFTKEEKDHLRGIRNYAACSNMVCGGIICSDCPIWQVQNLMNKFLNEDE